jgi:hypothetical protein
MINDTRQWWCMPLSPVLGRQRESSKTSQTTQKNLVSKKKKKKKKKKINGNETHFPGFHVIS